MNRLRTGIAIIVAAAALHAGRLGAQQASEEPSLRLGATAGASYNGAIGDIGRFVTVTSDPLFGARDFSGADGFGGYGGIGAVYAPAGTFGAVLRMAIDDRSLSRSIDGDKLAMKLLYAGLEPGIRVNLGSPRLYIAGGPAFMMPIEPTFSYDWSDGEQGGSASGDVTGVHKVSLALWGELGYDILLNGPSARTALYLTPFVAGSYLFDQKKMTLPSGDEDMLGSMSVRAGVGFSFGARKPLERSVEESYMPARVDFTVSTPKLGITGPRQLVERMPLVGAIFFDRGSTAIPARYVTIDHEDAARFDERVIPDAPGTGAASRRGRAERQLATYHNVLNILGSRMVSLPAAKIALVGSAEDTSAGQTMAIVVKSYLVSTFSIDPRRIDIRTSELPLHASGSEATPEEDLPLVAEENNRVEIIPSDPQLLAPVEVRSLMEEPFDNDLRLTVKCAEPIESWSVTIAGEGFRRTYGPYYAPLQRINGTPILGDLREGHYTASLAVTTRRGIIATQESRFELTRREQPPTVAHRYAILFDYDRSETMASYESFLRTTVAGDIPEGGWVFVHGHTDVIGNDDHNAELSALRALKAELIVEDQIKRMGRSAVFDIYGFGENESRAPFPNDLPEGRFYNRTVTFDIVPGDTMRSVSGR